VGAPKDIDQELWNRLKETADHIHKLYKTLLSIQIIVNEFKKEAPYTEENVKKGVKILRGRFLARTQGKLHDVETQYQAVDQILAEWKAIGGVKVFREIEKLYSTIRARDTGRKIQSLLSGIIRHFSSEGTFYKLLHDKNLAELTEEKIEKVTQDTVVATIAMVKSAVDQIDYIIGQVKSLGRTGLRARR
jgi:hypothetical protein